MVTVFASCLTLYLQVTSPNGHQLHWQDGVEEQHWIHHKRDWTVRGLFLGPHATPECTLSRWVLPPPGPQSPPPSLPFNPSNIVPTHQ